MTLALGMEYLIFIAAGALFQVFGTGLIPLIRNMGGSLCAMFAMSAGFIANIILDWLFIMVFGWGMAGAAAATVIGQAVTALGAVLYLPQRDIRSPFPRRGAYCICSRRY